MDLDIWLHAVKERVLSRAGYRIETMPESAQRLPLSPSQSQGPLFESAPLRLSHRQIDPTKLEAWQNTARAKLCTLLKLPQNRSRPTIVEAMPPIDANGIRRRTFYLSMANGRCVPVTFLNNILSPGTTKRRQTPILLFQGGSASGVYLSWGEARQAIDLRRIREVGADMGRQAAKLGWTVVCVEQFGYGDRSERLRLPLTPGCKTADAFAAGVLVGESLVGERVKDLCGVVDWLCSGADGLDEAKTIDLKRITLFGHSSGGTTAIYTAAVDERIQACIASGCLGFIRETLTTRRSGEGDAIVPNILEWMEMDSIVGLIAPRIFLTLSGESDHIWPISGGYDVVQEALPVWRKLGNPKSVSVASCPGGHRPYPAETWRLMEKHITWFPKQGND